MRDILYGNGVQQGDNMAPILFIYIMMAATNTLRHQIGKEKPKFWYFPNNKNRGRFIRQPTNSKGETFSTDNLLYVDDGVFLTESREEAKATAQKIYTHFAQFGLQMHMGSSNKRLKMEAIYFPPSMKEAREQNELLPDLKSKMETTTFTFLHLSNTLDHT